MKLALIMPCYNEGKAAAQVIRDIVQQSTQWNVVGISETIICLIDDGSIKAVQEECTEELQSSGVTIPSQIVLFFLRHSVNLGQGAAIRTGIQYALQKNCDTYVTLDSDGQHPVAQIPDILAPIQAGHADIVFGNRFGEIKAVQMPVMRRFLLRIAALFERTVTGLNLSDAHNGFRAMDRSTARLMRLEQNRMAHATEIKQIVARNRLRYAEVPVTITYSEQTLAKGQRASGAAVILKDLVKQYLFEQLQ